MKNERLYYVSNYDNQVHNINDVEHEAINYENGFVDILSSGDEDGYVIDQVVVYTLKDMIKAIGKSL